MKNSVTEFIVAVWWPKDGGYGGSSGFGSLEEAMANAESLKRSGYGRAENPIHIIKRITVPDEIVVTIAGEK